ncbi:MAG TPA: sugar phosphate isomerase/epimerase family protein [Methanoregulaceae archaeon]|nr:MAG: sugar phosphate isomerase/epimerase [Methanolinea sp.]HON81226.1 sugar phosphate isomerase/epimerase family protein [Methanoregulaceae archaeon]HPD10169.1 sugar phosphate isomerase/epimerase family protein [Methanoregulaceae archaeon]HRT15174.1 sugar phosphate isomerase/epimerase family protein [Methanoregulaceae archaeon]HRU30709.1 sugar phosphate isomerase/epimerase family protein [Methanoregulaceae archaeon]
MTELGCSTWCLLNHDLADVLDILSARTGTVEILSDARHDLLACSEACSSFDLRYTVHSPTTDINIASYREPIRQASLNLLREVCREAGGINAGCVVVHPGFSPWLGMRDQSYEALRASLRDLAAIQEEYGVPVAIENMGAWQVCHFKDPSFLPVLEEEGLSFCLDIGHANVNGLLKKFLAAGNPLHVHLHDNNGYSDEHLALGTGCIDFSRVFPRLPSEATWIIEVEKLEAFDESVRFMAQNRRWRRDMNLQPKG